MNVEVLIELIVYGSVEAQKYCSLILNKTKVLLCFIISLYNPKMVKGVGVASS